MLIVVFVVATAVINSGTVSIVWLLMEVIPSTIVNGRLLMKGIVPWLVGDFGETAVVVVRRGSGGGFDGG